MDKKYGHMEMELEPTLPLSSKSLAYLIVKIPDECGELQEFYVRSTLQSSAASQC